MGGEEKHDEEAEESTMDQGGSDDESGSEGDSECDSESAEDLPPQRLAFVVMTCVIGGYTLIGPLQHDLKHAMNISDVGQVNEVFTQSVAMVQWGKTLMTLGQNVVLACVPVVARVYVAMTGMFLGTLLPPLFIFTLGCRWVGIVPISYGLIGLSLGVFECTYVSVISPLGPKTKSWAIMGFPAAFALVNIVGQSLMVLTKMKVVYIFWYVVACQPLGILAFRMFAPESPKVDGKSYKQASICASLREWRTWFVQLVPFLLVNVVSHFVMESVLPAVFNTYNAPTVSLLGPRDDHLMNKTWFLVLLSIFVAVGDMSSRKIGYLFKLETHLENYMALCFALSCSSLGLFLTTQGIASLTWLAVFLAFFGAGFNYAVTSKYIDRFIGRKHNLAGYSVWMFVGYCGAISGAVLVSMVRGWICGDQVYAHQCLANAHH